MSYTFLQNYWWFIVSLLGAILVFLLFVQGANSVARSLGYTEEGRRIVYNSTGRKWLQAVSYEFQNKIGNILGPKTFQFFLTLNGIVGPLLLGGAVATFFEGSNFIIAKDNMVDAAAITPIISRWANASHGLDALLNPWVLVFGFAVVFLARVLGILYIINNVDDENIRSRASVRLIGAAVPFVVLFVAYLVHLLVKEGYAINAAGLVYMEPYKYLHNMIEMWGLLVLLLSGVIMVLFGIIYTIISKRFIAGIWQAGLGTIFTVLALLLLAGWNNTAYYPSTADLQSSLTLANSCSSEFTLRTMFYVSLLVPFVLAYIFYAWRAIDKKKITKEEIQGDDHAY